MTKNTSSKNSTRLATVRSGARQEWRLAPVAMAAILALHGPNALAQPPATQLPVLRTGSTPINATVAPLAGSPTKPVMNITQTGSRGVVEWSSFNIGSQASVNINQPNAQSVLINRVSGTGPRAPSQIYGALHANGRVLVVDPAGIVFGPGAQVNVGSLVATSLDLNPSTRAQGYREFLDGKPVGLMSTGAASVQVMESASLKVSPGGQVVLLGSQSVTQHGAIEAAQGRVSLGVSSQAEVLPVGTSGFVDLVIAPHFAVDGASIQMNGSIRAGSTSTDGGTVHIDAGSQGEVVMGAAASVQVSSAQNLGGHVTVQGRRIALQAGDPSSTINADGALGGGSITLGGSDTRDLYVAQGVTLSADATLSGHGGNINALANFKGDINGNSVARLDYGVAEIYGQLQVRGGTQSGNGGSVDTSGTALNTRLYLPSSGNTLRARVDASARAASGRSGTWTLDPYNVTISNTASTGVSGTYTPTGPDANILASDISDALNAGTNVAVSTGTIGVGSQAGTITVAPNTSIVRSSGTTETTLTLTAHDSIVLSAGSSILSTTGGRLNVNLLSDLDGNGVGQVSITGAYLGTQGGNLFISGGATPAEEFARGINDESGISIINSQVFTQFVAGNSGLTPAANASDTMTLRGAGVQRGVGVNLAGSNFASTNINIVGRAAEGTAVRISESNLRVVANETTTGNAMNIQGVALRTTAGDDNQAVGVDLSASTLRLGVGSLTIAGRGDDNGTNLNSSNQAAVGVQYSNLNITANSGSIELIGEAANSTGSGIRLIGGSGGLTIGPADPSSQFSTLANVSLGAISSAGLALELGTDVSIRTSGAIGFRPAGVDVNGDITEITGAPIFVTDFNNIDSSIAGFYVDSGLFSSQFAGLGFSIGSRQHTGEILLDTAAVNDSALAVSLQNQGARSEGITLGANNSLGSLGLLTAGNITQEGGLTVAGNLTVQAGATSNVDLSASSNQIGVINFDSPNSLSVVTLGDLTVDATFGLAPLDYDGDTGSFGQVFLADSRGGDIVLRSAGAAVINRSITAIDGTGVPSAIDIVSPVGVTMNNGATLTGERSSVWAPVINGLTGASNLYGCVYGDVGTCATSGVTLPNTGLQGLFPTQPTLIVRANSATAEPDQPLPDLTYELGDATGANALVNGDTAQTALSGTLATTATPASPTGTYAITAGSLSSPTGYVINFTPATLAIRLAQAPPPPRVDDRAFRSSGPSSLASSSVLSLRSGVLEEFRSDVYGRNLIVPYVCTSASVIQDSLGRETGADPLASEWGKVRSQPHLSACLEVVDGGKCAAF